MNYVASHVTIKWFTISYDWNSE